MANKNIEREVRPMCSGLSKGNLTQEGFRLAVLDYAKALSVFYVICIHVGFYQLNEAALFVMPLFFAATGYSFSKDKRTPGENIQLRFRSILIPFWIYMVLYSLIEMIRAPLLGYGSWKILFPSLANTVYGSGIIPFNGEFLAGLKDIMSYKEQVEIGVDTILPSNCHLWFLPAMFTAYVIFVLLAKKSLKSHLLKGAAVLGLFFVASAEVAFAELCQLPYGIGRGAVGAIFMLFGFWAKEYGFLEEKSLRFHAVVCLISAALFAGALLLGSNGSVFVRSYYGPYSIWSLLITLVGGTAGTLLVFQFCRGIERLPFERIKRGLSFAGKNVFTVYTLHMAVKTVFDILYIKAFPHDKPVVLDEFYMGLVPERACIYMIFEVVAVIAVCLLLSKWRQMCRGKRFAEAA